MKIIRKIKDIFGITNLECITNHLMSNETNINMRILYDSEIEEEIVLVFKNKERANEFIEWLKNRFIVENINY